MRRLQGKDFYSLKDKLKIVGYTVSSNDNIRVNLCHKNSKNGVAKYYHWLSDIEKRKFLQSDYYKNTPASVIEPKQKKVKKTEINDYSQDTLDLMQLYSHLGVEAFGEDIQEQAVKEIDRLKEYVEKRKEYKISSLDLFNCLVDVWYGNDNTPYIFYLDSSNKDAFIPFLEKLGFKNIDNKVRYVNK